MNSKILLIAFTLNVIFDFGETKCTLPENFIKEVHSYESVTNNIFEYVMKGPLKNRLHRELRTFVKIYSPRYSGSTKLEESINYMINLTKEENIRDVYTEEVIVPYGSKLNHCVTMLEPYFRELETISIGSNTNTSHKGITAEVIEVVNFTSLHFLPDDIVQGKIVFFNPLFTTFSRTVRYRRRGLHEAARKGAAAVLVKSISSFSAFSTHVGLKIQSENSTKIPAAEISIEHADWISHLLALGNTVKINFNQQIVFNKATSRNTIIDISGTTNPDKIVVVSGHIDTLEHGQGALDSVGGVFVSWATPVILKRLNLKAKRTIRTLFLTGEEVGSIGSKAYAERHKNEIKNIVFTMECDEGTFLPTGIRVSGTYTTRCVLNEILKLFSNLAISKITRISNSTFHFGENIPSASLLNEKNLYKWLQKPEGDIENVLDSHHFDLCVAFWACLAYITADLSIDIPL